MLKVGDKLPAATLQEYIEVEGNGCSIGPNPVDVQKAAQGKTIAIFALPGAFTPTCSAKHVPGYMKQFDALHAAGVDEIWCISVNDAFVMGAWARDQKCNGKVRMLADGSADFTQRDRPDARPVGARHGHAFAALFDAGRRRCRQEAERRGAGQVRGQQCRDDARTGCAPRRPEAGRNFLSPLDAPSKSTR